MKILICGAHGFVGRHIRQYLLEAGHEIIDGVHQFSDVASSQNNQLLIDYSKDTSSSIWERRFAALASAAPSTPIDHHANSGHIDIVINAVGILNSNKSASFEAIHRDTPIALFQAANDAGVKGIVQISALGPDDHAQHDESSSAEALSPYLHTKRDADQFLSQLACPHLILRPSLIIGVDGASSQLFRSLASMPLIGLPGKGEQTLQPVHIDDLCHCIGKWVTQIENNSAKPHQIMHAVGPTTMSYRQMLAHYRQSMGLGSSCFLPIPMPIMRIGAVLAQYLPQKVFAPETLRMLEQGNTADCAQFSDYLGHAPKAANAWFHQSEASHLAAAAIATWSKVLFRFVLALLWIATGIISLWIYPHQESALLLSQVGISDAYTMPLLYAASGLDFAIGIITLTHPSRRLWQIQILVILLYSLIISLALPEFLVHPFGPILKNLPILAILFVLLAGERK